MEKISTSCGKLVDRIHYIYALREPDETRAVRYVGQTIDPAQRYFHHVGKRNQCGTFDWIQSLIKIGKRPAIELLDECKTQDDADASEAAWASHFIEQGFSLLNKTIMGCPHCNRPVFVNIQRLGIKKPLSDGRY